MEKSVSQYEYRINRVINYIDKKYNSNFTLSELANIACFSDFHFHRIFTCFMGESPLKYINRRRIEMSIHQLLYTKESITDIALKSGFSSSANYTKKFKKYYSITPSKCRKLGEKNFANSIKPRPLPKIEEFSHSVTIEEIKDFNVAYVTSWGKYSLEIPLAWLRLYRWGGKKRFRDENAIITGITYDNPNISESKMLRYEACISVADGTKKADGIDIKKIEGGFYATVIYKGKYRELPNFFNSFYMNWLFKSEFELADRPILQIHTSRNNSLDQAGTELKICIPVKI